MEITRRCDTPGITTVFGMVTYAKWVELRTPLRLDLSIKALRTSPLSKYQSTTGQTHIVNINTFQTCTLPTWQDQHLIVQGIANKVSAFQQQHRNRGACPALAEGSGGPEPHEAREPRRKL
jgi:hypothetical protein